MEEKFKKVGEFERLMKRERLEHLISSEDIALIDKCKCNIERVFDPILDPDRPVGRTIIISELMEEAEKSIEILGEMMKKYSDLKVRLEKWFADLHTSKSKNSDQKWLYAELESLIKGTDFKYELTDE